jgi:hypothetical protein
LLKGPWVPLCTLGLPIRPAARGLREGRPGFKAEFIDANCVFVVIVVAVVPWYEVELLAELVWYGAV